MTFQIPRKKDLVAYGIVLCVGLALGLAFGRSPPAPQIAAGVKPPAAELPILVYHQIRIGPDGPPDGMTVISYERFAEEMRYLHDQGYTTLGMDEVTAFLQGKKFPDKVVALHFDDGWASAAYAFPLLDLYNFKASFWIIPGSVGTGSLFMNWGMLQTLDKHARFGLYSHTVTHPWKDGDTLVDWVEGRTAGKSRNDALFELTESKKILEEKLGHSVPYLAWPRGVFNDALLDMARQAGYTATVTTEDGLNPQGLDAFHIQRVIVNGACDEKTFEALLADAIYRSCGK